MSSEVDWSKVSDEEKIGALSYLFDEGFIEAYQDESGGWFIRVTDAGSEL
jgi:DNA-binding PadR family transcriptional regulator